MSRFLRKLIVTWNTCRHGGQMQVISFAVVKGWFGGAGQEISA